ncbi:DUF4355 domain-containing protein [Aerococcus urinaeequi]|uniref:DUF4355 domain-containing protein n=1 Tax=Aerococcus urinaeequi TaxID=51665 RepID=UPI003670DEFC
MKFDLQYFAEDAETNDVETNNTESSNDEGNDDQPEFKYTDADVDAIVKKKLARAEKEKANAVAEAEKLAKMNADDKEKYERQKLEDELAEYRKREAVQGLLKEADSMLKSEGIDIDDELLKTVIGDDAETTKNNIKVFAESFNSAVEQAVKKALSGEAPAKFNNVGKAWTKDEIMNVTDANERQKLIQENRHLF